MNRHEDASSAGAFPPARGSPTRRRLLALLAGLPAMGSGATAAERSLSLAADLGSGSDAIPRLFIEFERLLERHEAVLSCCDRQEATLLAQMDYPRVPLPPGWDGSHCYAGDDATIARVVSPARHRRRLRRLLQRRQRRWDEAAHGIGLTAALAREAALDEAVLDKAAGLLATPARTLDAVVLKLLVLLSVCEPGPAASTTSRWRELRLILADLKHLAESSGSRP